MIHLRGVRLGSVPAGRADAFPFSVPAIRELGRGGLAFRTEVTFLVGENGSGKSTLLEGVAAAARAIVVGSAGTDDDPTLGTARTLGRALQLDWSRQNRKGFFLRAEDFFGFAKRMGQLHEELTEEMRAIVEDPTLSARARGFGSMPYARELAALKQRYGEGLDARSHGEAFLMLFQSRFAPNGLYLLDEPEAPLSPGRQLALIALMKDAVEFEAAQFVVATHSPILMAFPGATIFQFDPDGMREVPYEEIEHVRLTKSFLDDPEAFLRHL